MEPKQELTVAKDSFPVVCIGMSAGAVEPIRTLFRLISPNTGMAFVIAHHLRNVRSLLPQILLACTPMPVHEASVHQEILPNQVYIIPSGDEIRITDGFFSVRRRSKLYGWANVFTLLLNSLAQS